MTKGLPLTTSNIASVLKRAGFVTNDGLEKRLGKFGEGLRKQINSDQDEARAQFYVNMTKLGIDKVKSEIDKVSKKLDDNTDKLSLEISGIKDDLSGLTAEFSTHHHTNNLKN